VARLKALTSLIALLALIFSSGPVSASQTRAYPAKIDGYTASDPATLSIRFHVYNNGTESVSPSCTITAQDSSGGYHGFDAFILKNISAGTTVNSHGSIVITGQGAAYVTEVKIACTAETSDSGTISGNVDVIRVDPPTSDGYTGHDSSGWFWGGIPIVSSVPDNTQVKCTVRGLDSSGHILTSYTFNGQVNQGGVSGQGVQNISAVIGQNLKNASASCELGSGEVSVPVPALGSQNATTPSTSESQQWYPADYEEDSPGFAWKWSDNPIDCIPGKNNECWNGTLIVRQGCQQGVMLTVGLYSDVTKKEVAKFTQKYFADFLPMTGVILSINNTANSKGPNAQIDADACISAKEGGNNPIPVKNIPINTLFNDFTPPNGASPLGNGFYVGTQIIKCSDGSYSVCLSLDITNTTYCSKGYTFSGMINQSGNRHGWFSFDGSSNTRKPTLGVSGGTEASVEYDYTMANLIKESGLSQAAIYEQLKSKNVAVINKATCLN